MTPYYSEDGITIYHGDCLEVMPTISEAPSVLLADPPYAAAGSSTNGRSSEADSQFFRFWMAAVFGQIRRVMPSNSAGFVFCDWRTLGDIAAAARTPGDRLNFGGTPWGVSQALVWDRESIGMGSPFRNSFEMIAFAKGPDWDQSFERNVPTVVRHRWPYNAKPNHGAEKPVDLLVKLIGWGGAGSVFDPFTGSGSALIAAQQLGRRAIGIEIEERYCEIAAKRLSRRVLPLQETA